MKTQLFKTEEFEKMASDVRRVLAEIGYVVDHPLVKELAIKSGCRESAVGRILFDNTMIEELRQKLLRQYPPVKPSDEPSLIHPKREFKTGIGNLTPKFYDYENDRPEGGNLRRFTEMVKFAHAEPRVTSITLPISRQDTAPEIEQLEGVVLMSGLTDKPFGGVDATVPEAVPFIAEMGIALGLNPARFVGCCNCINPPLRLEYRTAETMLQRRKYHSRSMITPMPSIGGSGPADIRGTIVLGTAEIVGGLILSSIIDPEAPLLGYIACNQVDMLTGNGSSCTPQTVRVDSGVCQLMEYAFGGGTTVGGRSYVNARRPGLQAVFERTLKAAGYAAFVDRGSMIYAGSGNLDNGSMISPEQCLLDWEVMGGLDCLFTAPEFDFNDDVFGRICETVLKSNGNFLETEHTLNHFRDERWNSVYFQARSDTQSEKSILDRCHGEFLDKLDSYRQAEYPDNIRKELESILKNAKKHLMVTSQ